MRRIIIANTHYQIIVALHLKYEFFLNDDIVLLITDHSRNSLEVSERIKESSIFEDVMYIKNIDILNNQTLFKMFMDFVSFTFFKKNRFMFYFNNIRNMFFDEILAFNFSVDIYGIYSILSHYNNKISVSKFEEGILAYNLKLSIENKAKYFGHIRRLIGKQNIFDNMRNFYCFYPEIYKGNQFKAVKMPIIKSNSKTAALLKRIYNLEDIERIYSCKYIYFASTCDFEGGGSIGEYELVQNLVNKFGKNNIIIKTHPRDYRNIYINSGYLIDSLTIPWEVIQMCCDFNDKVLITAISGSLLSGSLIFNSKARVCYVYKLCNINSNASAKKSVKEINRILNMKNLSHKFYNFHIVNSIDEI